MKKLLKKLMCSFVGHKFGPPKDSETMMFFVEIVHIGGTSTKKDIPGFTRESKCDRCGATDHAIVFTPLPPTLKVEESDPEYWN